MSKRSAPIYPAYAFKESPTWDKWVRFTAADIHGLREEAGFQGQDVYFHLNHPIRFVCLTGLVVSIDDRLNKYTLLELDDGSGSIVVIKVTRNALEPTNTIKSPSNTNVPNLDVLAAPGRYDVFIDKAPLDIGAVVKVKCTISEFRGVRQLDLKRIRVLRSTAEEAVEWENGARFKMEILDHPWKLSNERLRDLLRAETDERRRREDSERKEEMRQRYAAERKLQRAEQRREHEERKEVKRKKEEDAMNAGALI